MQNLPVSASRPAAAAGNIRRPRVGILGSGEAGQALGRLCRRLGWHVSFAAPRGDAHLAETALAMGAHHEEVAALLARADLIMLAVPLSVIPELATATLAGKIVLDCINPTAAESVALAPLLAGRSTSRYVADHFPGARLVKAFNTLPAHLLLGPTRRRQGAPRYALPVAADDEPAKKVVLRMVAAAGFAPLDAGTLAGSWRLQIGQPAYGQLAEEPELVRLLVGATPARPLIQVLAENSGPASARPPGSPVVDPLAPLRLPGESYLRGLMQHETEF